MGKLIHAAVARTSRCLRANNVLQKTHVHKQRNTQTHTHPSTQVYLLQLTYSKSGGIAERVCGAQHARCTASGPVAARNTLRTIYSRRPRRAPVAWRRVTRKVAGRMSPRFVVVGTCMSAIPRYCAGPRRTTITALEINHRQLLTTCARHLRVGAYGAVVSDGTQNLDLTHISGRECHDDNGNNNNPTPRRCRRPLAALTRQ